MAEFNYPPGTKRKDVIDDLIPNEKFMEVVFKQWSYDRIQGKNLIQDADDLTNLYLKICKEFPES